MIPGDNGKVVSNAQMGGGGTTVVINNNAPGVQVMDRGTVSDGMTEQRVIEIINQQSAEIGSGMNVNMNKNHNITSKLSGNRRN